MQGSTVVIDPPDGDMAEYLASLEGLLVEGLEWLAPGHGFLIARPADEIRRLVRHRLAREAKVAAGLRALGAASWTRCCRVSTTTCRRACTLSLAARCWPTCSSSRATGAPAKRAPSGTPWPIETGPTHASSPGGVPIDSAGWIIPSR